MREPQAGPGAPPGGRRCPCWPPPPGPRPACSPPARGSSSHLPGSQVRVILRGNPAYLGQMTGGMEVTIVDISTQRTEGEAGLDLAEHTAGHLYSAREGSH